MSLEHRDERRLTDQERDRILDVAARLQAQHDSTTSLEELERTAEEAGIAPRFVRQAAARPDLYHGHTAPKTEEPQAGLGPRVLYGLASFAAGGMLAMPFVQQNFSQATILLGIVSVSAMGGYALGRRGEKAWIAPALSVFAFFLGIQAMGVLMRSTGFYRYAPSFALFSFVALAAGLGAALGRHQWMAASAKAKA